uniref:Glycosyltransferase n=1 Tax=Pyrodinium bahamense TaxID=73915 RepID=A0A7S0FG43_9DINO
MASDGRIPLCVFAKPPRPGRAKTRLAAVIGDEAACDLATAFISDFISLALSYEWAMPVLATTEDGMDDKGFPQAAYPPGVDPQNVPRWLQPAGDLGAKLEGVVRRGLEAAPAVICCGADSPGRPRARLEEARERLQSGCDAVLGPTEDGGYDILGLRQCPDGLLADLPWSQPTTFEATYKRFEERGLRIALLDRWWDVDEVEDLQQLRALFGEEGGEARAPATAAALARAGLAGAA